MARDNTARVCSICLAPGPLLTLTCARQVALRVVGPVGEGTCKAAVTLPVLCAHVRRVTLPPTQLGVAWA